jgi:membrane-associated phospholipid phosphatase
MHSAGVAWRGWSTRVRMSVAVLLLLVVAVGVTAMTVPAVAAWDRAGVETVAGLRTPGLTPVMETVSSLASAPVMLTGVVVVAAVHAGWTRRPSAGVRLVLVVGVGWAVVMALKPVFGRDRPGVALADSAALEPLVVDTVGASYPSGHTALATGLALGLAWGARHLAAGLRVATVLAGMLVVGLVGLSRVYLGVHYPSDVLGAVLTVTATTLLLTGILSGPRPPGRTATSEPAAGSAMLGP